MLLIYYSSINYRSGEKGQYLFVFFLQLSFSTAKTPQAIIQIQVEKLVILLMGSEFYRHSKLLVTGSKV